MFNGIYCKEKSSNTVFESILIDYFNNCINSSLDLQSDVVNLADSKSIEMNSGDHISDSKACSSGEPKSLLTCCEGQNVRAVYSEDGEFYEAVVEKVISGADNNLAVVRFHGYGNDELVSVNSLFPSLGQDAIKEQIELSKLDEMLDDEQIDDDESVQEEINWKIGMACRALYEKNDIIYEGTVLEINDSEKTALVEMIGYDVCFETNFENMYESIPEFREKQEISAKKYINEKVKSSETTAADRAYLKENKSNSFDCETKIKMVSDQLKEQKLNNTAKGSTDVLVENHSLLSFSTDGILQPESESEALACLISANYLNGYYAGYYDCIRKRQNPQKS